MTSRFFPALNLPTVAAFGLILIFGIYLRISSPEPLKGFGFDEKYYSSYVEQLSQLGLFNYSTMAERYLELQKISPDGVPPPTRVAIIVAARAWQIIFGTSALASVHAVSCAASIIILIISTLFIYRIKDAAFSLASLALMAFTPMELYMAHRALADSLMGLVVLIILWALWELLQNKSRTTLWLMVYGVGLFSLVLIKENAAFPYVAGGAILLSNRWLKLGQISRSMIVVTLLAPFAGLLLLCLSTGGVGTLVEVYSLLVSKSLQTPYNLATGNGPWFRYIFDLLLVNPAVLIFAIGGAYCLTFQEKAGLYFLVFIIASFIPMSNLPHGFNVRYATIWDLPLVFLALIPLFRGAQAIPSNLSRKIFLVSGVTVIAFFEIKNYLTLFVDHSIYDPVPAYLIQALGIINAQ